MKRIIFCLGLILAFHGTLRAQDPALVERVNKLSVYVEELLADKARQQKQITDLTRELESLRDQVQRAGNAASREDLQALADTVQQVERKQREDMKAVADAIDKIGKTSAAAARAASSSGPSQKPERGWEYTIKSGNTLSAIAQAYRDEFNIKITADDILKANPGLSSRLLTRVLVRWLDIADDAGLDRLEDYSYPPPDAPHPVGAKAMARKIHQAQADAGQTPVYSLAHGYGPLDDFRSRLAVAWNASRHGMWVNRYAYLTDAKLDAIRKVTRPDESDG